jgi:TENA/THI-4/PQQC family
MLHDVLWRSNLQLAHACLAHLFVQALGEGTLKADLFRAFIAQGAFFLGAFRKACALALARSDETESITSLYELLGGVLEELKLHRAYATELGIDLESVVPNPAWRRGVRAAGEAAGDTARSGCRRQQRDTGQLPLCSAVRAGFPFGSARYLMR